MILKLIRYGKSLKDVERKDNKGDITPRESDKAAQVEWEVKLQNNALLIQTENNFYHLDIDE